MEDSILISIKKMLGIDSEDTSFDLDIITHINSAFSILRQLGVGPSHGYQITGTSEEWSDYLGSEVFLNTIRTYVYLKVRKVFDPPQNSVTMDAVDSAIKECEWRINVDVDTQLLNE